MNSSFISAHKDEILKVILQTLEDLGMEYKFKFQIVILNIKIRVRIIIRVRFNNLTEIIDKFRKLEYRNQFN